MLRQKLCFQIYQNDLRIETDGVIVKLLRTHAHALLVTVGWCIMVLGNVCLLAQEVSWDVHAWNYETSGLTMMPGSCMLFEVLLRVN